MYYVSTCFWLARRQSKELGNSDELYGDTDDEDFDTDEEDDSTHKTAPESVVTTFPAQSMINVPITNPRATHFLHKRIDKRVRNEWTPEEDTIFLKGSILVWQSTKS